MKAILGYLYLFNFLAYYADAMLTPAGVNYEVQALMEIKKNLDDPHNVLNWDGDAVDPCSWNMVTCSYDKFVTSLLLQSNDISGSLPMELGMLKKLKTIDLSDNKLTGEIPSSLAQLKSLQYLRLNNNSLTGAVPLDLANMTQLSLMDLSFNSLSGPVPRLLAKTFNILGNPMICATGKESECNGTTPMPLSFSSNNPQNVQPSGKPKTHKVALAFGTKQHTEEVCLGNLRRFQFKELQSATNNFSSKNILGKGGFGNVYKGRLSDGIIVAVKRLKDGNAVGGNQQFQTEVALISLAVHRNLLRLYGFCMTPTERLLVYPYMSNGSVASRLKAKPTLDWGTRKGIALGAARGLLYLHEQCDPKIIHRDVKAANILLDDYCEAVVGDFGLAKLLDHHDSHVTTAVRGTVGHIAPEYLSTGQSSDKTDVFGFGILLLELITGQRALEFGKAANQKGAMLDWVRKIQQEKKLDMLVDKDMKNEYDTIELEEMVQVALLCTQYHPSHRPKMSEVVRMLEGDGLAEKWEASQRAEPTRCSRANEFSSSERYSDLTDDSSLLVQAMELSGPR
ncbi:hypothetical protein H5410_019453 [Solanum commersonii]|uniref:non-specific serine/threonine protein kinase n=1 Tax=Solanum commersonii TaxID=4109 RepID=A0A9J5Z9M6_SOLCO|nr:hypothetical protein H5410_019453 [Solanum commersonii]